MEDLLIVLKRENGIDSEDDCESDDNHEIEIDVRSHVLEDTQNCPKRKIQPQKITQGFTRF